MNIVIYKYKIGKLETAVKIMKFLTNATDLMGNGDVRLYLIQDLVHKDTSLKIALIGHKLVSHVKNRKIGAIFQILTFLSKAQRF